MNDLSDPRVWVAFGLLGAVCAFASWWIWRQTGPLDDDPEQLSMGHAEAFSACVRCGQARLSWELTKGGACKNADTCARNRKQAA